MVTPDLSRTRPIYYQHDKVYKSGVIIMFVGSPLANIQGGVIVQRVSGLHVSSKCAMICLRQVRS